MKLSNILALSAILGATTLPMAASAQFRSDRGKSESHRRDNDRRNSGSHHRRDNDRKDWNNRNDRDRRDNDRWDRDRRDRDQRDGHWRDRDRRDDDRWGNNRWDDNRWDNDRRDNDWLKRESDRRQDTKNEWRNIAIGAGALSILGLLQGDNTLFFGGAAGALYSLHRYEQDRKSQSKIDRARATYFGRDYFYRDGIRFDRQLVTKNGQRYYQFIRHR